MFGGNNAQRYHDLMSRRDAARILRDAERGLGGGGDEDPGGSVPWYRNVWAWVSIVMVVLIGAWLIAVFT